MHELEQRSVRTRALQTLAHVVLHRLDVVIDARLDLLDTCGGFRGRRRRQRI
jgi:hypothetical protein